MVRNILSLTSSGLKDWLIQRFTALIIAIYTVIMLGYFISHPQLQFDIWQAFFSHGVIKIMSFLVLFSILLHAWQGMWTVFTDYIKNATVRLILEMIIVIVFFGCLVWGAEILWGT